MLDLLLDPDKALDAVNNAVRLVKKAASTVDNVESLGPVLGKYFDAKANAIACIGKTKAGGFGGSSMGKALELELAIENARAFEAEVQKLFFASNKMDVWQRIKARAAAMEVEAAKAAAAEKRKAAQKKKETEEAIEVVIAVAIAVVFLGLLVWGGMEMLSYCKQHGCGR